MIKRYLLFSTFALFLALYVVFSIISYDNKIKKAQIKFTTLTTIIEPSFSSSLLEDRFLFLTKSINSIYPTMPKIDKKGFVYAK